MRGEYVIIAHFICSMIVQPSRTNLLRRFSVWLQLSRSDRQRISVYRRKRRMSQALFD